MPQQARTDIGFQGGQVLAIRLGDEAYEQLTAALAGGDAGRWHTLESDDERVQIDLANVVYVRRDVGDQKIGF